MGFIKSVKNTAHRAYENRDKVQSVTAGTAVVVTPNAHVVQSIPPPPPPPPPPAAIIKTINTTVIRDSRNAINSVVLPAVKAVSDPAKIGASITDNVFNPIATTVGTTVSAAKSATKMVTSNIIKPVESFATASSKSSNNKLQNVSQSDAFDLMEPGNTGYIIGGIGLLIIALRFSRIM